MGVVKTPSILGEYRKYAVSTDAEPCAKIGSDLLANGGSAVDAAIGTLICMGVILPNSLGLGGGCLMTIYDAKKKEAVVIDGRETAPVYAHENMFANDSLQASRGPLSIGVPGELAAYWKAHQRFGKLQWSHLFNGSIKYAEEGYPMVEHLSNALKDMSHAKYMNPSLSKLYTNPEEGRYYRQGEIFVQPVLAATLKRIRDSGADEFYGGLTGQNFIQDLKDQGGKMTLEDLMKYEALTRAPLQVKVADDLLLYTQPPPGSGVVLSIILRVMHKLGYYKNLKPQASFEAAELYYHRLAESFKFAYGQRAGLEDNPDDPERMKQLMEKLLSEKFIEEISSKVDGKTHNNEDYGGLEYFRDDHGTAHVSVLDAEGNAAAVSTSVNLYFGAGMYSPSTGITYNDVMDDFVSPHLTNKFGLAPSKYNRIRPGKRPLSSMVPSIFTDTDGNVRLVVGGAGGTKITTGVAMVSLRNCFLGEDIKTSIDGPRIHHQFLPNKLYYEINFPKDLVHSLSVIRNHTTEAILGRSSIIMGIASERTSSNQTRVTANSDYRKGGSVHGQ